MKQYPLVSVVVTTFNRPDKLYRALESIHSQTYLNIEVFVVDGGCRVENERVVDCFNYKYIGLGFDRGVQAARNIGLRQCKGEYVAMLDDDDIWYPEKISIQMEQMLKDDSIGLVICYSRTVTEDNVFNETPKQELCLRDLLVSFNLSHTSTYLLRKSVINKVGGWDENLVSMHEYDLGLRIAKHGFGIITVPVVLMEKNNSLDDNSREFYGSFFMKIHEVFLLWRYYGMDMMSVLSVKDFFFNGVKTVGLIGLFFCGYLFGQYVWRWVYIFKVWYEKLMNIEEEKNMYIDRGEKNAAVS